MGRGWIFPRIHFYRTLRCSRWLHTLARVVTAHYLNYAGWGLVVPVFAFCGMLCFSHWLHTHARVVAAHYLRNGRGGGGRFVWLWAGSNLAYSRTASAPLAFSRWCVAVLQCGSSSARSPRGSCLFALFPGCCFILSGSFFLFGC